MQRGSKPKTKIQEMADSMVTILWMTSTRDHSQLRKIPGCDKLADIPAKKDLEQLDKLYKMVKFDHVFRNEDPTKAELGKSLSAIMKISTECL